MSRSRRIADDIALGALVNTALLSAWLGALVAWSRRCEAHKRRG
jgi:hypothetical protein